MMSNSESRKRLDESTARPESGPRACDGTPQGCIVKPCNSPVPCGGCCWCLGGCDVDPAPVAEPADGDELSRNSSALSQGDSVEALAEVFADLAWPIEDAREAAEAVLASDWLARRDEKRDRETVGNLVERVEAVLTSWENSSEAARYHWTRALCADLRAALGDSTESGSR